DAAGGYGQIICYDQEVFRLNLFLLHPVPHCITAAVHEGGGLEQHQFSVFVPHPGNIPVTAVLKNDTGCCDCSIQYHKSYVMTRVPVLVANVAKTGDKMFHYAPLPGCSLAGAGASAAGASAPGAAASS